MSEEFSECPQCGHKQLSGLMASFWVSLNEHGDMEYDFHEYASETEVGPERMCSECGWESDDATAAIDGASLQPECCRKLVEAGWRFTWEPDTRFVSAEHPLGGKQSFIRVEHPARTGFEVDQIGQAIAMLLNASTKARAR